MPVSRSANTRPARSVSLPARSRRVRTARVIMESTGNVSTRRSVAAIVSHVCHGVHSQMSLLTVILVCFMTANRIRKRSSPNFDKHRFFIHLPLAFRTSLCRRIASTFVALFSTIVAPTRSSSQLLRRAATALPPTYIYASRRMRTTKQSTNSQY